MDTWYYKGDETIIAAGFDGSDVLAGTVIYDTDPAPSYEAVPWAEYDVTELI